MNTLFTKATIAIGISLAMWSAHADQGQAHKGMGMDKMHSECMKHMEGMKGMQMDCADNESTATSISEGEVKAVNMKNKKITLKHGPIENMNMGAMTMAFPVSNPSFLSKIKVGDKVNFKLEAVKGVATITVLTVKNHHGM